MKELAVDAARPRFVLWLRGAGLSLGARLRDEDWLAVPHQARALLTPFRAERSLDENLKINQFVISRLRSAGFELRPVLGVWRQGQDWGQEPTNLILAGAQSAKNLIQAVHALAIEAAQDSWIWAPGAGRAELVWTRPELAPEPRGSEEFSTFNPRIIGSYYASLLRAKPAELKDPRWRRTQRERCEASPDPDHHYFWIESHP